ncbi:hypothetical protein CIB84_004193 [Bambusicola thoracicus]|uniref:Uncharacterized protein n=1 Tax=Bambusicola thoracicus TaxID=9083 RepID=A0A2P4T6R2_BAMTH|nr:hypothetical protein CIB84_004193 [Bambusicola thoracicus]
MLTTAYNSSVLKEGTDIRLVEAPTCSFCYLWR